MALVLDLHGREPATYTDAAVLLRRCLLADYIRLPPHPRILGDNRGYLDVFNMNASRGEHVSGQFAHDFFALY